MTGRDLFGQPIEEPSPDAEVTITLHKVKESDKAWLLSKTGMDRDAHWIPKSRCSRDELRPNHFTLTRKDALERGWL